MATWKLEWPGEITIPDRNLRETVQRKERPSLGPWWELVHKAIENPIGSPPLHGCVRPGMKVAVLLTDVHDAMFGATDGVGMKLFDCLNAAGIPDRDIALVHAAGLHGHAGAKARIGDEVLNRVAYAEHHPLVDEDLVFKGATWQGTPVWINKVAAEADFMLGFGGCGPSLFGFQGGAGIILPGISGADTIRHNHIKIMNSGRSISGWWPGNAQRMDVLDAGDLVAFRFKIDVAVNTVFAGYPRDEWPIAVEYVKENMLTRVKPTDIYVHAPGSVTDLCNAVYLHLEYGCEITRPNGIVIICASCHEHVVSPPRPVEETLAELTYCTEMWAPESGTVEDQVVAAHWRKRDVVCKEELMKLSLSDLSRILSRRLGEPRSTAMSWSHKAALKRRRVFLVSKGVSPDEGAEYGFAYTTDSFADAMERALKELGPDAEIVANVSGVGYGGLTAPGGGVPYPWDE